MVGELSQFGLPYPRSRLVGRATHNDVEGKRRGAERPLFRELCGLCRRNASRLGVRLSPGVKVLAMGSLGGGVIPARCRNMRAGCLEAEREAAIA
jgi:hypothetical protein